VVPDVFTLAASGSQEVEVIVYIPVDATTGQNDVLTVNVMDIEGNVVPGGQPN